MGTAISQGQGLDNIGMFVAKKEAATVSVREALVGRSQREVFAIGRRNTVFEALGRMAEKDVGALVVVDGENALGVVSERDYARKVILIGMASRETAVEKIMGAPAVTVATGTTVAECMALMTGRRIRHLPVVSEGVLIGLASSADVVTAMLGEMEARLGKIQAYISGTYPASRGGQGEVQVCCFSSAQRFSSSW